MGSGAATGRRSDDDDISYYEERPHRTKIRPQPSVNPLGVSEQSRRPITPVARERIVERRPSLNWPLPPDEEVEQFKFDLGSVDETYSVPTAFAQEVNLNKRFMLFTRFVFCLIFMFIVQESKLDDVKVAIQQIKQQFIVNMQKESSNQSDIIALSNQSGSATLDAQISAKSHFCVNLQTEDQVNILLQQVSSLYLQLDSVIQKRYALLSKQTQLMITKLTGQVQVNQQNLLIYAKKRQERQNQLYNQFLGAYVKVLNQWKANELNKLQQYVVTQQGKIVSASQNLMISINQSSSTLRNQILTSINSSINTQVNQLIGQIGTAAASKIGTQLKMMIGMQIDGQVGDTFPEGTCPFEGFDLEQPNEDERKKVVPAKKTTVKIQNRVSKETTDQRFHRITENRDLPEED